MEQNEIRMKYLPLEMIDMILLNVNESSKVSAKIVCSEWNALLLKSKIKNGIDYINQWALEGNLELMKWAKANGCPWNVVRQHLQSSIANVALTSIWCMFFIFLYFCFAKI